MTIGVLEIDISREMNSAFTVNAYSPKSSRAYRNTLTSLGTCHAKKENGPTTMQLQERTTELCHDAGLSQDGPQKAVFVGCPVKTKLGVVGLQARAKHAILHSRRIIAVNTH